MELQEWHQQGLLCELRSRLRDSVQMSRAVKGPSFNSASRNSVGHQAMFLRALPQLLRQKAPPEIGQWAGIPRHQRLPSREELVSRPAIRRRCLRLCFTKGPVANDGHVKRQVGPFALVKCSQEAQAYAGIIQA